MFDAETLGTIAQLGLGLAGFSGIVLVLTRGGGELTRLEVDRLGIMLGSSLGAAFLGLLPLIVGASVAEMDGCGVVSAVMAAYTAGFLRYYVRATYRMSGQAPELVNYLPFGIVTAAHGANFVLQVSAVIGLVACVPSYLAGLMWLLVHGAYQFGRILFIRPHASGSGARPDQTTGAAETDPEAGGSAQ